MLNWALRYGPVAGMLDEARPARVLDVGSGRHGLATYWRGATIVHADLDVVPGRAAAVAASVLSLPFADRSIDAVVALDLLEHLPPDLRPLAVDELARVASGTVLVACPVGPAARAADERHRERLERRGQPLPAWLTEHLSFPPVGVGEPRAWVARTCRVRREEASVNARFHEAVLWGETLLPARMFGAFDGTRRGRAIAALTSRGPCYREVVVGCVPASEPGSQTV